MNDTHRLSDRNIWVVGASSGIGAALATELHGRGARVAISARRKNELDAVAAGRMTAVPVDVTDRAALDDLQRPRTRPDGDRLPPSDGRPDEIRTPAPGPGVGRSHAPGVEAMTTNTTTNTTTDTNDTSAKGPAVAPTWPELSAPPRAALRGAIARPLVRRAVAGLPLRVQFPDGTSIGTGGASDPVMVVHRPDAFFARLAADAKIGFGEAYMAGDWDTGPGTDLADLLTPLASNVATLVPRPLQRFRGLVERRQPAAEQGTPSQARQNIQRHYDLSNDLFASFLDETLSYSSAIFEQGDDLAAAQRRKTDAILDLARVGSGSAMLEIGTGWGQLAIQAAQRGAHVTTVTLSTEQRELALRRIAHAGVSDRVRVLLADYREVTGAYDAIVSVEMIEAVGLRFWPDYFATLDQLLRPGGRVGLQSITISHQRMLATRDSYTWIHKYIFPGGIVPSVQAIESTLRTHTSLAIAERRDFGRDYATTLKCWRDNFLRNWPMIAGDRFDGVFKRMWEFYLAYCEAGFRASYLGVSQFALVRT